MEKNKKHPSVVILGVLFCVFLVSALIIISLPKQEAKTFPNPDGYYCVIKQGIGYFNSEDVPKGAILVKPNPDYTGGDSIKYANINFLKMVGCIK